MAAKQQLFGLGMGEAQIRELARGRQVNLPHQEGPFAGVVSDLLDSFDEPLGRSKCASRWTTLIAGCVSACTFLVDSESRMKPADAGRPGGPADALPCRMGPEREHSEVSHSNSMPDPEAVTIIRHFAFDPHEAQ